MNETNPLFVVPSHVETRWATAENLTAEKGAAARANAGRKGYPFFPLDAGEQKVIGEVRGHSGMIRWIYATVLDRSPKMLRGMRIDIYWDGASKPAVSAPLGDLFGLGLGMCVPFESAVNGSAEGKSFHLHVPMPFRKGFRAVITNETDQIQKVFAYAIEFTVGDEIPPEACYFHAHWRRENPTTFQRDYEILPRVEGRGRFLGSCCSVIANQADYLNLWWGEGEPKVYLDGDREYPTIAGSGTEDYFGSAWDFGGSYTQLYHGLPVCDMERMRFSMYRYHVPDPVYFHRDCRMTIQQMGSWGPQTRPRLLAHGKPVYKAGPGLVEDDIRREDPQRLFGLFERRDDWSSCAYFYLDRPENDLPPLPSWKERVAGL